MVYPPFEAAVFNGLPIGQYPDKVYIDTNGKEIREFTDEIFTNKIDESNTAARPFFNTRGGLFLIRWRKKNLIGDAFDIKPIIRKNNQMRLPGKHEAPDNATAVALLKKRMESDRLISFNSIRLIPSTRSLIGVRGS